MKPAAYTHCSLKVGVPKSSSFGLLLHYSSTVKSGTSIVICLGVFKAIIIFVHSHFTDTSFVFCLMNTTSVW